VRYVIKSSMQQKSRDWAARAFRGETMVVDIHRGASEQAAINAVKMELEAIQSRQRALRGREGYPTVEEVRAAIRVIGKTLTKQQWDMLKAHLRAANYVMTATEIAAAGGYDNYGVANIQYGQLGRKLAKELEWEPPIREGKQTWTFALAEGADEDCSAKLDAMAKGHWRWKLRREVVEALQD
jgi:hypothetical protein